MQNSKRDSLFEHFIRGMDSKMQAQLSLMYAHNRVKDEWLRRQEKEQLKREITEDVLSRISFIFETSEAIEKIDSLNKALEKLGR